MKPSKELPGALAIRPNLAPANVNPLILLIDCSYSMNSMVNGKAAYMHARDALKNLDTHGQPCLVMGFSSDTVPLQTLKDIKPEGCTFLFSTLVKAAALNPRRIIVITDGHIDDATTCRSLIESEMLDLDGIFVGDPKSTGAEELRALIAPGTIVSVTADQLTQTLLLTAGE